ncbi:MAG: hypothetical protein ACE5J9_03935 [Methanosarcinales archaeon]
MDAVLMEQKIENLIHRMDALEERVEKAQPDIILKEIMGINRELGSLTEKVEYIKGNIKEINVKIQELKDKIISIEENLTEKINTTENKLKDDITNVKVELTEKINEVEKNLKKEISDLGKTVARTDYMLKFIIGLLLVALGVLIKSTFF